MFGGNMSVNYDQYCIVGVCLDASDCKKITSEAIYEHQPRYNPKTGKETHKEKVLVKQEEYVYREFGCEDEEFDRLMVKIANKYDLNYLVEYGNNEEHGYIGKCPVENSGDYNVSLIDDSATIQYINEIYVEVKDKLNCEPELHMFSQVG